MTKELLGQKRPLYTSCIIVMIFKAIRCAMASSVSIRKIIIESPFIFSLDAKFCHVQMY